MSVFLWIVGVLSAVIVTVCLTRVGGTVYFGQSIRADLYLGLFHFRIDPAAPKKKPKKAAEKKPAKAKKEITAADLKGKFPKLTVADVGEIYHALWPVGKKALACTRRGIRIAPFRLFIVFAGEDPAALALLYGKVNAGIWTLMPQLERVVVIPSPQIHTELSFTAEKTSVEGELGISARIGTLLLVGLRTAIPVLRWFLRFYKTHRPTATKSAAAPQEKPTTAA